MAASTQDILDGIERRRLQLQTNVDKLQRALSHWTTWFAEYEALKEEIQAAQDPSPSQMHEIVRSLQGTLVNEEELQELLGRDFQRLRSANQVADMISRRIDYVQQNSATIEKQLDVAEKQLAGVDVLLEPGMHNEDGLPMMDIEEQLDEEGNELSSSVNQTGKGAAEIVDALRKVGLQKIAQKQKPAETQDELEDGLPTTPLSSPDAEDTIKTPVIADPRSEPSRLSTSTTEKTVPSKSVSFVENAELSTSKSKEASECLGNCAANTPNSVSKVFKLGEDGETLAHYPIIPQGESPEDAELRRQMLQYGLSEVGQVVAELDLDQPSIACSDDESDMYDNYNTDEEDEEDEYGRSTRPVLSEEYRKQMMELEKKLSARMLENIGPPKDNDSLTEHIGDVRTMRISTDDQFDRVLETSLSESSNMDPHKKGERKGVRFADTLDIPEKSQPEAVPVEVQLPACSPVPTITDTVVERPVTQTLSLANQGRLSRDLKIENAQSMSIGPLPMLPATVLPEASQPPTGPAGCTLASIITEHISANSEPQPPDEFDALAVSREIQAQYHRARNKFIGQQGGFTPSEGDEDTPIVEERNGRTKKVSRFMAARLKADGM